MESPVISLRLIGGEEEQDAVLDFGGRLLGFEFRDSDTKADQATLTLANDDLELFGDARILHGQEIQVQWGYEGRLSPIYRLIVEKVTGFRQVKVVALAKSVEMNKERRVRAHSGTYSDIVRAVASEYGYSGSFLHVEDTSTQYDTVSQHETDAVFLKRLARAVGFVFYVDHTGFHWHGRRIDVGVIRRYVYRAPLEPGVAIIGDPKFDADFSQKGGLIKVVAYDPLSGERIEGRGSEEDSPVPSLGEEQHLLSPEEDAPSARLARLARSGEVVVAAGSEAEAMEQAGGRFRYTASKRYEMGLLVLGDPEVGAKALVQIEGVSDFLSGRYYVAEATHKIQYGGDAVYSTELKCVKDATGRSQAAVRRTVAHQAGVPLPAAETREPVYYRDADGRLRHGVRFRRGDTPTGLADEATGQRATTVRPEVGG